MGGLGTVVGEASMGVVTVDTGGAVDEGNGVTVAPGGKAVGVTAGALIQARIRVSENTDRKRGFVVIFVFMGVSQIIQQANLSQK